MITYKSLLSTAIAAYLYPRGIRRNVFKFCENGVHMPNNITVVNDRNDYYNVQYRHHVSTFDTIIMSENIATISKHRLHSGLVFSSGVNTHADQN